MFDLSRISPKYPANPANLLIEQGRTAEIQPATPANPAKTANPDGNPAEISRLATLAASPAEKADDPISRLAGLAASPGENAESSISRLATLAGTSGDSAAGILAKLSYSVRYITDTEAARQVVSDLLNADHPILGLDIETGGLDPLTHPTRCIQIADNSTAYVFDLTTVEPIALWGLMQCARQFVAHNGLFEFRFLKQLLIDPAVLHDSMLMARCVFGLQAGKYMSLADLASRVLGITVDKSVRMSDWMAPGPLAPAQINYAALDAVLAYRLAFPLRDQLRATGQAKAYGLMMGALPTVGSHMLAGVGFDREGHLRLIEEWKAEAMSSRDLLDVTMQGINPDSPAQLAAWLGKHLPADLLTSWPKTGSGQLATDADTLMSFDAIPDELRRYKKAGKLLSTYGAKYAEHIHPITGRIHADYSIAGTVGGRFKCARPNLQNPPRLAAFRRLFQPSHEMYRMVVADYSQVELRIAALLSQDAAMLQAYREGVDLHRLTASVTSGVPLADVTKDQRQAAKAINFGLIYGMQPAGLRAYSKSTYGVDMSSDQAKTAHAAFFQHYQGIHRWHMNTKARGVFNKTVRTVGGLVRDMTTEAGGWKLTNALNTPVQGSGAEVLLLALAKLRTGLSGLDCRVVHHVHDEIILECAETEVEQAKAALQQAMTSAFDDLFPGNGMAADLVEAHDGRTWEDAKG